MKIAEFQWFYPFCLLLTSFQMVYNRTANPKLRSVNPITNSKYAEKQPYNLMPLSVLGCTDKHIVQKVHSKADTIFCVLYQVTQSLCMRMRSQDQRGTLGLRNYSDKIGILGLTR